VLLVGFRLRWTGDYESCRTESKLAAIGPWPASQIGDELLDKFNRPAVNQVYIRSGIHPLHLQPVPEQVPIPLPDRPEGEVALSVQDEIGAPSV
jgi:hypothetical protein